MTGNDLPFINACLNGTSTVLLCLGLYFIKTKQITAHRNCMITAFVVSCVFLVLYLYHKYAVLQGLHTKFPGPDSLKVPYYIMLFSHIILAAAVPVLALMTISRGLKMKVELHKKIARWTFPIWLYVSITGVLVYLVLYVFWAPRP